MVTPPIQLGISSHTDNNGVCSNLVTYRHVLITWLAVAVFRQWM